MSQITDFAQFRARYQYDPKKDKLGEGGFGMVYKARDKARTRTVAIKRAIVKENQVYTLQREVELASKLPVHANIAFYENEVYRFENDAGEEHDYAIMQYYPQGNLSQYVKTQFLDATMRKSLVEGILLGLAHLHKNRLIHRDLKPSNILITLDDDNQPVPKIADFGISKVADAGKSLSNSGTSFTLAYMSPEQGRLQKIDHRSDLWAVGAVLYFICTGRHAFASNDSDTEAQQTDIRDKVLNAILPNDIAQLPAPYNEIVRRCLIDDRNQRAQSAAELLLLLNPTISIPNNRPDDEGTIFNDIFPPKDKTPKEKTPIQTPIEKINAEKQKTTTTKQAPTSINKQVYMLIGIVLLVIMAIIFGLRGCGDNNNSQANNTTATTTVTEPTPTANDYGIEMVYVQGGTFTMGCTREQTFCSDDEKPTHSVTLSSFSIGKYEVMQAQWRAVMGNNPSKFSGCDSCPVERVSWDDVQNFISKLNQLTGKRYRLPTEAEWEYAARGGSQSKGYQYSGSNNIGSVAWYDNNSRRKTHAVGGKSPNELGIYDMTGNVSEWCSDWYDENYYKSSPSSDPNGASSGSKRTFRGGSWDLIPELCRVAIRGYDASSFRENANGFRLLLPQ